MISTLKMFSIADSGELLRDGVEDVRVVALGRPLPGESAGVARDAVLRRDRPYPLVVRSSRRR